MIKTNVTTTSWPSSIGMPVSGSARIASTRALPMTTGDVCVAAAGSKRLEANPVFGYGRIDVAVLTGAFPGISAWRPPN